MTRLTRWLHPFVKKPASERRRTPRFAFSGSIEVRMPSGATFRGVARDLSVRGLGAIVYADLKVGDSNVIRYTLPQLHPSTAVQVVVRRATVRARYGSRYGFEFQHALEVGPSS